MLNGLSDQIWSISLESRCKPIPYPHLHTLLFISSHKVLKVSYRDQSMSIIVIPRQQFP